MRGVDGRLSVDRYYMRVLVSVAFWTLIYSIRGSPQDGCNLPLNCGVGK